MFCPKCGTENANTNKFCRKCGKNLPDRSQIPSPYQPISAPGLLGQTIDGRYRIEAKLGSGGMGDVYRATRLLIDDTVAIKILHPHLARVPEAAERFRREAKMATKLRHRNVVGLYDVGIWSAQNVPYILMELAEGFTLRQIIAEHRIMPLDFAVTVTTQVCAALDEAHSLGIVHRDIKPENIIANQTTTGWYIKVLDFGIAKLYNQTDISLTQDGNAMGTPQYMSPEQCMGEALDARSDIYSVGIMLYEMLCGSVPFKAAVPSALAVHHVHTAPQKPRSLNDEIHPEVEAVILKSISKLREQRQQKASLLARDLIRAATIAFRSGFTEIPAEPLPEPEAEPEFAPSDEDGPDDPAPAAEIKPEGKKKAKRARSSKKKVEREEEKKIAGSSEPESAGGASSPVTPAPPETDIASVDFAVISEAAELRLNEILRDGAHSSTQETQEVRVERGTKEEAVPVPDKDLGPGQPAEDYPETAGDLPAETGGKGNLIFISAAVGAALLIIILGAGYMFSDSNVPAGASSNTSGQSKKAGGAPPAGMVLVPGGEFMMGSDSGGTYARPAHRVTVKPFYMDITEVTNEEYKRFVDAAKYTPPPDWKKGTFPDGKARFPVTGVNWHDAAAYAKWAGKRLPAEDEWEFAARGTDGRIYSWGNEWKDGMANANKVGDGMTEAGTFKGASPFGIFDLIGNAWEWTSTTIKPYPGGLMPEVEADAEYKVIRGGSWNSDTARATAVHRGYWRTREEKGYENTGFRCVKDAEE